MYPWLSRETAEMSEHGSGAVCVQCSLLEAERFIDGHEMYSFTAVKCEIILLLFCKSRV